MDSLYLCYDLPRWPGDEVHPVPYIGREYVAIPLVTPRFVEVAPSERGLPPLISSFPATSMLRLAQSTRASRIIRCSQTAGPALLRLLHFQSVPSIPHLKQITGTDVVRYQLKIGSCTVIFIGMLTFNDDASASDFK
jgi:hypothetical protein